MDKELLDRYLRGTCTASERERVEQWLEEENELPPASSTNMTTKNSHWQQLEIRLAESLTPKKKIWFQRLVPYFNAAAVVLVIGIGLWFVRSLSLQQQVVWLTLDNPPGKQLTFTLPDGSLIRLAGGTSISYPKTFTDDVREIRFLKGEAYLTVQRDVQRSFIVHTAEKEYIQVLGTSFNMSQIDSIYPLQITLLQGSIAYQTATKRYLLVPGEQLISHKGTIDKQRSVDITEAIAWTKGILWFKDTPIQKVFSRLEQHFGVTFIGTEKVRQQSITGKFKKEPLDHILDVVGRSLGTTFSREGRRIVVIDK